ncbi:hypothetical protein D1007_25156 [Hordeum vulgare]|nr:hypothetical protein D1007_25156 [Hordeum vulgare]
MLLKIERRVILRVMRVTGVMTLMMKMMTLVTHVVYHGKKCRSSSHSGAASESSGGRAAGVESSESDDVDDVDVDVDNVEEDDANVEADDGPAANIQASHVRAGDEHVIESQIMLTAASNTTTGGSGDVRKKSNKDVKKVHFEAVKTRSSPCVRALQSQPAENVFVDLEEHPTATSPVVVPEVSVTGSWPPSQANATTDPSQTIVVDQLAAAATITTVVEEIAAATVIEEEAAVDMQVYQITPAEIAMHESERVQETTEQVAEGSVPPVDGVIVAKSEVGEEPTARELVVNDVVQDEVVDSNVQDEAHVVAQDEGDSVVDRVCGDFTPPSCSLRLDSIFVATPPEESRASAQATPVAPQAFVVLKCTMSKLMMMKYSCGGNNMNMKTQQQKEKPLQPKENMVRLLHKEDIATPRSLIRKVRVTRPSQYLLPPYSTLQPSEDDEAVYNEVIKHTTDSNSKIKDIRVIDIDGRWVMLGELANCVREIGQLLFPVLQKLGPGPDDGHWYVLSLNLKAKRFEVLDSLREEDSPSLLEHATRYMNAIKKAWLISYKDSHKQIQDYELVYIDVLKQENDIDCGFFTFMFLELSNQKKILLSRMTKYQHLEKS